MIPILITVSNFSFGTIIYASDRIVRHVLHLFPAARIVVPNSFTNGFCPTLMTSVLASFLYLSISEVGSNNEARSNALASDLCYAVPGSFYRFPGLVRDFDVRRGCVNVARGRRVYQQTFTSGILIYATKGYKNVGDVFLVSRSDAMVNGASVNVIYLCYFARPDKTQVGCYFVRAEIRVLVFH